MAVLIRREIAGISNMDTHEDLCFKFMPQTFDPSNYVIWFWDELESGEVIEIICDKCEQRINSLSKPIEGEEELGQNATAH